MFLLLCGLPKYLYLVINTVFFLVEFTCNYCTILFNLINDKCKKNRFYYYYYYYYYYVNIITNIIFMTFFIIRISEQEQFTVLYEVSCFLFPSIVFLFSSCILTWSTRPPFGVDALPRYYHLASFNHGVMK